MSKSQLERQRQIVCHKAIRLALRANEKLNCHYCGREVWINHKNRMLRATGDHLIPLSRGGINEISNVVVACYRCNKIKGPLTDSEFLALRNTEAFKPYKWKIYQRIQGLPENRREVDANRLERAVKRVETISHRIKESDPDCPHCEGTGLFRKIHICRCSIIAKEKS